MVHNPWVLKRVINTDESIQYYAVRQSNAHNVVPDLGNHDGIGVYRLLTLPKYTDLRQSTDVQSLLYQMLDEVETMKRMLYDTIERMLTRVLANFNRTECDEFQIRGEEIFMETEKLLAAKAETDEKRNERLAMAQHDPFESVNKYHSPNGINEAFDFHSVRLLNKFTKPKA